MLLEVNRSVSSAQKMSDFCFSRIPRGAEMFLPVPFFDLLG